MNRKSSSASGGKARIARGTPARRSNATATPTRSGAMRDMGRTGWLAGDDPAPPVR